MMVSGRVWQQQRQRQRGKQRLVNEKEDPPILEVPDEGDDASGLEHTSELGARLVVIRTPVEGLPQRHQPRRLEAARAGSPSLCAPER